MPRQTPADRARERAARDALLAVLRTVQRVACARAGVPVPTKSNPDPVAVLRLRLALSEYAAMPPGTFMRDVRLYLAPRASER